MGQCTYWNTQLCLLQDGGVPADMAQCSTPTCPLPPFLPSSSSPRYALSGRAICHAPRLFLLCILHFAS